MNKLFDAKFYEECVDAFLIDIWMFSLNEFLVLIYHSITSVQQGKMEEEKTIFPGVELL